MKQEKMDFAKVLAMLAQPKEPPAPLENVEKRRLEVHYISKEKKVEMRLMQMFLPMGVKQPMPLIYVPHYEMGEDAYELRKYLKKGWAVASPAEFNDNYNAQLTDDDLVFNNAALYTLRHLPEIDKTRIALVGGSAGGYMTLMLHALQLGICGSVANGPITNVYFNFHQYFQKANRLNLMALAKLAAENGQVEQPSNEKKEPLEVMQRLAALPIPFLAGLAGIFTPLLNNFPDVEDIGRWEALSPVALTEWFSSPLMVNHNTSDVLVPIDQITKQFTYAKPGESLPEDFDSRLPETNPGKLKYSLEERLPEDETSVERILVTDPNADGVLPFAEDKRFQINIWDNGPVEGYGSHSSQIGTAKWDDIPYLESIFARTAVKANVLTPEKLRAFLGRFNGQSVQLPAHEGIDDSVYGSLEVYRKEVCEELAEWTRYNSIHALEEVFGKLLAAEEEEGCRIELRDSMSKVKAAMEKMI